MVIILQTFKILIFKSVIKGRNNIINLVIPQKLFTLIFYSF